MNINNMKPCPHCGSNARRLYWEVLELDGVIRRYIFYGHCKKCGFTSEKKRLLLDDFKNDQHARGWHIIHTKREAIAAWNAQTKAA